MSELAAYLHQLDHAWSHAFESLTSVLDGVDDAEACWQAPCYSDEERADGWPPPGSVAWQIAHLVDCKLYYASLCRRGVDPQSPEAAPWTPCEGLAALRAALASAHAEQVAAITALGDERLELEAGNGTPFREFLAMCIRHDTWHGGQIAVARRLYRTRPGA